MTTYFGKIFNEINIERTDSDGNQTHLIEVPLQYGPKNKSLVRTDADPDITRPTAIVLPRMSFELTGMAYAADRKLGTTHRYWLKNDDDKDTFKRQYNCVAYDYFFSLHVYVNQFEDGTKIIEQIVPMFTPEFTSTINIIPEMNIQLDHPVVLNDISKEDIYDGEFEQRRAIIWTLNFTINGFMFGPIVDKPIIKIANTRYFIGNTSTTSANDYFQYEVVTPGLDANGNPTTNAAVAIPVANVDVDDDWDYVVISNTVFLDD
jgi:hypothetical protein